MSQHPNEQPPTQLDNTTGNGAPPSARPFHKGWVCGHAAPPLLYCALPTAGRGCVCRRARPPHGPPQQRVRLVVLILFMFYVLCGRLFDRSNGISTDQQVTSDTPSFRQPTTINTNAHENSLAAAPKEAPSGAQLLEEVGAAPLLRASDGKEVGVGLGVFECDYFRPMNDSESIFQHPQAMSM